MLSIMLSRAKKREVKLMTVSFDVGMCRVCLKSEIHEIHEIHEIQSLSRNPLSN